LSAGREGEGKVEEARSANVRKRRWWWRGDGADWDGNPGRGGSAPGSSLEEEEDEEGS
jgi:hypothetical protein